MSKLAQVNMSTSSERRRLAASRLLILGAAALQLLLLVQTQVLPISLRMQAVRGRSAVDRSAILAFGDDFAAYVRFLRGTVPIDGKVILPPSSLDIAIGSTPIMQYYLFPRRVDNCGKDEIEACVLRATGKKSYMVAVAGFPPRELAEQSKIFVQFEDERGVYVPQR